MHRIDYLRPAFLNDELTVLTWVADWRKVRSLRRYRFIRSADQILLAEGETEWVFVDAVTGRPKAITEHLVSTFGLAPDGPAAAHRVPKVNAEAGKPH
jgi:acyl-CoA thioester hydrolase